MAAGAMRSTLVLSSVLVVLARSSPAKADAVASAAAQVLFDEARRLMSASRFSEACPKLAESQRLEPTSGTLLNLGMCHEKEGKIATAWLDYHGAVTLAIKDDNDSRRKIAADRIAALDPRLSKLQVKLPERLPPKFWLTIDNQGIGVEALHALVPLDPGKHDVRYGAQQSASQRAVVTLLEGKVSSLTLLPLRPESPSKAAGQEQAASRSEWFIAGAGLGVATVAFGSLAYFGVRADQEWSTSKAHCPQTTGCDAAGVDAGNMANEYATAANIALGVGIVASVVGGYFLVKALGSPEITASVGHNNASFAARWQL